MTLTIRVGHPHHLPLVTQHGKPLLSMTFPWRLAFCLIIVQGCHRLIMSLMRILSRQPSDSFLSQELICLLPVFLRKLAKCAQRPYLSGSTAYSDRSTTDNTARTDLQVSLSP